MGRLIGYILVGSLVIYGLQLAFAGLVIVLLIAFLIGLYTNPSSTIGGVLLLFILGLGSKYPVAALTVLILLGVGGILGHLAELKAAKAKPLALPSEEDSA